jgi:hypothetical protein
MRGWHWPIVSRRTFTHFHSFSVFAEANFRYLFKSEEDGDRDPNTGGTAFFLTPGFRVSFNPNFSFTVSAPLPVVQDLNGSNSRPRLK